MPILRGAVTFARYRVEHRDSAPSDVRRHLVKGLRSQAFEPLDAQSDEDRTQGFVELENPDGVDFSAGQLFQGERALFSWRIDQLKVSSAQLRDELERWSKHFEEREGRRPAKSEKSEQRGAIRHQLRARATPLMRLHDVNWNLKTAQLQVWSASRKVVDEILAVMETAFAIRLVALTPGALASEDALPDKALAPTPILVGGSAELSGLAEALRSGGNDGAA